MSESEVLQQFDDLEEQFANIYENNASIKRSVHQHGGTSRLLYYVSIKSGGSSLTSSMAKGMTDAENCFFFSAGVLSEAQTASKISGTAGGSTKKALPGIMALPAQTPIVSMCEELHLKSSVLTIETADFKDFGGKLSAYDGWSVEGAQLIMSPYKRCYGVAFVAFTYPEVSYQRNAFGPDGKKKGVDAQGGYNFGTGKESAS
jgi:hypothetical protein